jgi:hypothetical protein
MKKQAVSFFVILALSAALLPVCISAESLMPPTMTVPSGWEPYTVPYPQAIPEYDSGAGLLRYTSSYGSVSIYYENDLGRSYSSSQLVDEAIRTFNENEPAIMNDSDSITVGSYPAAYASGYNSTSNQFSYSFVFTANNYYVNILISHDANEAVASEVASMLDSITIPYTSNSSPSNVDVTTPNPDGNALLGFIILAIIALLVVVVVVLVVVMMRRRKPKTEAEQPGPVHLEPVP